MRTRSISSGPDLPVAHREAGAGRADVGAAAALQAAVADLLPGLVQDAALRDIAHRGGEPARRGLEALADLAQDGAALLDVRLGGRPEHRLGEERLARGRARHGHELVAQVHELQVEMLARGRAGVGADAETLVADVALRIGADDVHQEQILPALLVVDVAELAPQVEAVQVPDARHVAGADAEDGALGLAVDRLDAKAAVSPVDFQQPFDVRQHEPLGRIVGVRQMQLNRPAVLVRDGSNHVSRPRPPNGAITS